MTEYTATIQIRYEAGSEEEATEISHRLGEHGQLALLLDVVEAARDVNTALVVTGRAPSLNETRALRDAFARLDQ